MVESGMQQARNSTHTKAARHEGANARRKPSRWCETTRTERDRLDGSSWPKGERGPGPEHLGVDAHRRRRRRGTFWMKLKRGGPARAGPGRREGTKRSESVSAGEGSAGLRRRGQGYEGSASRTFRHSWRSHSQEDLEGHHAATHGQGQGGSSEGQTSCYWLWVSTAGAFASCRQRWGSGVARGVHGQP